MTKEKSPKNKVYVVTCDETDLSGVIVHDMSEVGKLIESDIGNAGNEIKELHFTVQIKMLSTKYLNSLPEYEG